jgi:SAM-dependent methyltransferase
MKTGTAPYEDPSRLSSAQYSVPLENAPPAVLDLYARYYPHYDPNYFFEMLLRSLHPTDHILEIGAGSGQNRQNHFGLRTRVARYVGIDPDPAVLTHPHLHERHQCSAESLPFPHQSFDLVFHNFVAEHFPSPLACTREIARVLKPGGLLLFQTPNRYYYASLAAQLTPHWFHEFYVRRFASGRSTNEVFPTFYRLNDTRSIKSNLKAAGFDAPQIDHHSLPPGYLRFHKLAFLLGVFFERTFERHVPSLRGKIIVTARKLSH